MGRPKGSGKKRAADVAVEESASKKRKATSSPKSCPSRKSVPSKTRKAASSKDDDYIPDTQDSDEDLGDAPGPAIPGPSKAPPQRTNPLPENQRAASLNPKTFRALYRAAIEAGAFRIDSDTNTSLDSLDPDSSCG